MRPYLLASAAGIASVVSAAFLVASCGSDPQRCTNIACNAGATYVGHVRASLDDLKRATFTFCVNDACGTTVIPAGDAGAPDGSAPVADAAIADASDAGESADAGDGSDVADAGDALDATTDGGDPDASPSADAGAIVSNPSAPEVDFAFASGVYAQASIIAESDGWALVVVQAAGVFTGTPDKPGPVQRLVANDGDRYRLAVTAPGGASLLDVTRGVHYTESYPNGKACDDVACRTAVVHAWPNSPPDLTCSGNDITGHAHLTLRPPRIPDLSTLRVCRNDVCDEFKSLLGLPPSEQLAGGVLPGPLYVAYTIGERNTRLTLDIDSDPAVLADGDRYTVSLTSPLHETLLDVDAVAGYTTTTPNEPGCDPYASRAFTFEQK